MAISASRLRRGFGPIYRRLFRCGDEMSTWEKLVLGNLLERLGQNATAWPSQQTIALDLNVSVRTVRDALVGLGERGYLASRRRGNGQSNLYELDLDALLDWAEGARRRRRADRHVLPP
jgi:DNA-binding transcriptional MocR family regulator